MRFLEHVGDIDRGDALSPSKRQEADAVRLLRNPRVPQSTESRILGASRL